MRDCFLTLPDGLAVSAKLFSPPYKKRGRTPKIHSRLPETILLVAIAELLADEAPFAIEWDDRRFANSLTDWLLARGANVWEWEELPVVN